MDKGFIMLSRKFFSHRIWRASRTFSEGEAWIDLIQSARFDATRLTASIGGRKITYGRGQYPASIKYLSEKWGWNSEKRVRNFLNELKKENMITTDCSQGINIITLCNYNLYNNTPSEAPEDEPEGEPKGEAKGKTNYLTYSELSIELGKLKGELKGEMLEIIENLGQGWGKKNNKDNNIYNNNIIPPPPLMGESGDAAGAGEKTWRDDFNIYRQELDKAFNEIVNDADFINNRLKFHPELDIQLSLQKAYEDYWSQEAGWKKKKASKSKTIDWPSTFRKSLDQPQNKIYKRNGAKSSGALTELQARFRKFLETNAPMLLEMPQQPTDNEVESLLKMNKKMLVDIVTRMNNEKRYTNYRNSVYQTIMEVKKESYG